MNVTLLGWTLTVTGALGLLTVADDWRHVGELAGVAAVLMSGLALIGASRKMWAGRLPLQWVPAGLAIGLIAGTLADHAAAGVGGGLMTGLALARAQRTVPRKTDVSEMGAFGWVIDPEGNRVELWQPPATPRCPQCRAVLADLSIRLAMATCRCDGSGRPIVD